VIGRLVGEGRGRVRAMERVGGPLLRGMKEEVAVRVGVEGTGIGMMTAIGTGRGR